MIQRWKIKMGIASEIKGLAKEQQIHGIEDGPQESVEDENEDDVMMDLKL